MLIRHLIIFRDAGDVNILARIDADDLPGLQLWGIEIEIASYWTQETNPYPPRLRQGASDLGAQRLAH